MERIKILNWDKYNEKRKDVIKPSWLRLENEFPQSPSLFGLSATDRYIFTVLICLANKRQESELEFEPPWLCYYGGGCFSEGELKRALRGLDGRVIEWVTRPEPSHNADVTPPARMCDEHASLRDETVRDGTRRPELKESASALSPAAPPALVTKKPDGRKSTPEESKAISRLIATYVTAWQARHNTRARPNVGGPQQGVLRRLVRDHPTDYLCELIQVYCQMQHKFFNDRKHDLATFERGYNEIALAHDRGDENSIDWSKVFGDDDGKKRLPRADTAADSDIRRQSLSPGTG